MLQTLTLGTVVRVENLNMTKCCDIHDWDRTRLITAPVYLAGTYSQDHNRPVSTMLKRSRVCIKCGHSERYIKAKEQRDGE